LIFPCYFYTYKLFFMFMAKDIFLGSLFYLVFFIIVFFVSSFFLFHGINNLPIIFSKSSSISIIWLSKYLSLRLLNSLCTLVPNNQNQYFNKSCLVFGSYAILYIPAHIYTKQYLRLIVEPYYSWWLKEDHF